MMTSEWVLLVFAALCMGFSKSGFSGLSLIPVFIFADLYGAKESLGYVLPLLVTADLILYPAYRKYGSWSQVWPLLWPALIGMGIAVLILSRISNEVMRPLIGMIILTMVVLQLFRIFLDERLRKLAMSGGFTWFAGLAGGVATTLANAAGPVFQLYMLSRKMPKMELLGIGARFFLLINLLKLPLNAGLNLVSWESLRTDLILAPVVAVGIFLGKGLVKKVPQKLFEWLVISFALVAGVRLLFF